MSQIYLFFVTKQGFRTIEGVIWSEKGIGMREGERGIGHAMLAARAAPRALSLAGRLQKKRRDSNGVAEAELL